MMKRFLSLCLALCLVGTLPAAHAASAPAQDEELLRVTALVKAQIDIGDAYEDFYGELSDDGLDPVWSLSWSTAGDRVRVEAKQDGTILWYYRSLDDRGGYDGNYAPSLPKGDETQIRTAAEAFLKRVLRERETVVFKEKTYGVRPLAGDNYDLYGTIYYDGLPTPDSFSIGLRAEDLSVLSYSRNEEKRVGTIPSKTPSATPADASAKLRDTVKLRLQYVGESENGKPSKHAVLRYVPLSTHDYFVDAQTGKLVDLTALREDLQKYGSEGRGMNEAADASAGGTAPSAAEQAGAALLEGALDKEALDSKLRSMSELGLSGFSLQNASYSVDRESGEVRAFLRYIKNPNKDNAIYKNAQINAKTGALLGLSTSYWDDADDKPMTGDAARAKAEAFLTKYEAQKFAETALLAPENEMETDFHYVQQVNGYPFPENYLRVGVAKDGTIDSLNRSWTEGTTFDSAEGLISAEAALDSYFGAHAVTLGYLAVPVKLNPSDAVYGSYIKRGYSYLNEWKLAYTAELDKWCYGVDAKSGEPVFAKQTASEGRSYTDLDPAKHPQAAALAKYGVGYAGDTFAPERALTQLDLIQLLLSADGFVYTPDEEGALSQLYEAAYSRGLLIRADYAPESTVTRAALVKTIVASTGYGKTADLPGIYRCSFTDEGDIPAAYYGYVATAQGMGLVRGDEKGRFEPNDTATREQAAIILYNFMSR